MLLETLDQWQRGGAGRSDSEGIRREVILLGGDVHFGFISEVLRSKSSSPAFKQLVTSAVHNQPPPGGPVAMWLIAGANAASTAMWGDVDEGAEICEGWAVDHGKGSTMGRCNFGVVAIETPGEQSSTSRLELWDADGHLHTL